MYSDLKGKTALVTGAGQETGIGYAIGRKLAASGMCWPTMPGRFSASPICFIPIREGRLCPWRDGQDLRAGLEWRRE